MLVHGSVTGGGPTWAAQRRGLARPVRAGRPGAPGVPARPAGRAGRLRRAGRAGSRGLCAPAITSSGTPTAASSRSWRLLVLRERRALADCDRAPVHACRPRQPGRGAFARGGAEWWANGPRDDPEAFLRAFLGTSARTSIRRRRLPPELEQGARTLVAERGPWEAEIPLDELAAARVPDARRLGRPSRRVRRGLRRARARARGRAARAPGLRPQRAAAPGRSTPRSPDFVERAAGRD